MADHKITLVIIVNGTPVEIEANLNAELRTVVNKALADTHNTGQPAERWQLSEPATGNVLDLNQKVGAFGFSDGTRLMLNLQVGVQG
jgi:hypothetical protein